MVRYFLRPTSRTVSILAALFALGLAGPALAAEIGGTEARIAVVVAHQRAHTSAADVFESRSDIDRLVAEVALTGSQP